MSSSSLASCNSDANLSNSEKESCEKCPRCRVNFDFLKRVNMTKVPLILHCKHTVCEDCIKRMCLSNNTFCPVCKEKFTVPKTEVDSLCKLFTPHYSLIGQLVWAKNSQSPNKKQMELVSTGCTLGSRSDSVSDLFQDLNGSGDGGDKYSFLFECCLEHHDQFLNIYCEQCNENFCCYCFLENHASHKATYLYKLSEEELEEMEMYRTEAEVVLAQLLACNKQIKQLQNADVNTNVDVDIKNYFADLHAKLHLAERNIRKKLQTITTKEADYSLVTSILKSSIVRVSKIVKSFNLLNNKQLNQRALYEEVKTIKRTPCKVISDQGAMKPIEFLPEHVFDDIEDTLSLRTLPELDFKLVPLEDWSDVQEKYNIDLIRRQTKVASPTEKTFGATSSTYTEKTFKSAMNEHPKVDIRVPETTSNSYWSDSYKPDPIRILITHINNINSFFIQKYSAQESLRRMNDNIGRYNKACYDVKIGETYGVIYDTKFTKFWRRGKVMEIINNRSQTMYKVYFIDYGNSRMVQKEKLRLLDAGILKRRPYMFECKLANPDEVVFDPNAHLHISQIIGKREVYASIPNDMQFKKVNEVDLFFYSSNGSLIPVRQLLHKVEISHTSPVTVIKEMTSVTNYELFQNSKQFSIGQEQKVVVTYIRDPSYICIQLLENLKLIDKMKSDLEKFYSQSSEIAYIPVVNTDIIVKYEDQHHGLWHRAKIISVNTPEKQVGVYFVDWGFSTTVSWSDLRLLTEEFVKAECQGIIVKLAEIQKMNMSQEWSEKVITFLRTQILPKEKYRMLVRSVKPLEIGLFVLYPAADVCVNALLVEKNLALSTGSLSETVLWPNNADSGTEIVNDLAFQMLKKSENVIMSDYEDNDLSTGLRLQVDIINFNSPDEIFFKFEKYKEKEDEFHKELQIHYCSTRNTKKNWKKNETCVVYDKSSNNYFRGVIKSKAEDHFLVYLYDDGRELKLNKSSIHVMERYFSKQTPFIHKCKLSNLKPAGDAGKWSNTAVEILEKIFTSYKTIYIKKIEVNNSEHKIGVIMWYCLTTPTRALEPSKVRFISVNQALIESGVGLYSNSFKNGVPKIEKPTINEDTDWNVMISEADEEGDDEQEETNENWNETCEEVEEIAVKAWPKPFKIENWEFNAILTCVDNDGFFSVRNEEMHKLYQQLEETISSTFESNKICCTPDVKWKVDDMCTINFEGVWYRGTVLRVPNNKEVIVEMIDFGSEHALSTSNLTNVVMFPDVQPLVNKVKLFDVYTQNGEWTAEDVSAILSIVKDDIKVVIKVDLDADVPRAEIYLHNGISVNDALTQRCPHVYRIQNKVIFGDLHQETDDDNESKGSFDYHCNFALGTKQKLYVTNVLAWKSYHVVLSSYEDCTDSTDFTNLMLQIQEQAAMQPLLLSPLLNEPCICVHPQKKQWARAIIYNTDSLNFGFIMAFFVDYGSAEMVAVNDLRKMKSEWFDLPVYMQIARVNIVLKQTNQANLVLNTLTQLIGKKVTVGIVSEDPLFVHLYNAKKRLIYEDLVTCKIIDIL